MSTERASQIVNLSEAINRELAGVETTGDGGASPNPPRGSAPSSLLSPGYHDGVPIGRYVRDMLGPEASVSTGVVNTLFGRSALHAWQEHPRLGGGAGDDPSARGEIGSAVHALAFGGQTIEYVEEVARRSGPNKGELFTPTDWATKDAKEARDAIRARGNLPMLPHQRFVIESAAESARRMLEQFGPGRCETTMLWQDDGAWCRGRPDFINDAGDYDVDLKTCDNADPDTWINTTLFGAGYDAQAALRLRGHEILSGRTRDLVFLLVELAPPFAASLVAVSPAMRSIADMKLDAALSSWRRCMKSGKWPGYDERIHYAEPTSRYGRMVLDRLGISRSAA